MEKIGPKLVGEFNIATSPPELVVQFCLESHYVLYGHAILNLLKVGVLGEKIQVQYNKIKHAIVVPTFELCGC